MSIILYFYQINLNNAGTNNGGGGGDGGGGGGLYRENSEVSSMSGSGGMVGGTFNFGYAKKQ